MIDIQAKADVEELVNQFYAKVMKDDLLAPFFEHLDWNRHLPKMIHFWSFVLLNESGYTTDVTKMHLHMPLKKEHFDRWIELFNATVDTLFLGEKADLAKQRAFLIRWTIESKINNE